jgi:hypothetical protein
MARTTDASRASRLAGWRQAVRRLRMPTPIEVAVVCELVALAYSVAANIIGVWADGWIAIGVGAFLPLFLIGGVYLLLSDRIPKAWRLPYPWFEGNGLTGVRLVWREGQPGALAWWANLTAAALLLAPPALASYHHQRTLLLAVHTPWWLAAILPLPVDGLAIRAALTLFRLAHQRASAPATGTSPAASVPASVKLALTVYRLDAAPVTERREDESDERSDESGVDPAVARLLAIEGIDAELIEQARPVVTTEVPDRYGKLRLPGRKAVGDALGVPGHIARHLIDNLRPLAVVHDADQEVSA